MTTNTAPILPDEPPCRARALRGVAPQFTQHEPLIVRAAELLEWMHEEIAQLDALILDYHSHGFLISGNPIAQPQSSNPNQWPVLQQAIDAQREHCETLGRVKNRRTTQTLPDTRQAEAQEGA